MFLFLLHFWKTALLSIVFLVDSIFLSTLWIYHLTLFWPARFLLRNLVTVLWGTPLYIQVIFLLRHSTFLSVVLFWLFDYWIIMSLLLFSCSVVSDSLWPSGLPLDCSPLGSSVHGIFQARTLDWVAISFSDAWKGKVKVKSLSRSQLLATPWTAAYQAPPSTGFCRQEYWSGVPLPSLPHPLGNPNRSKTKHMLCLLLNH